MYKCSPRAVQPRICHRFRDISSQNFDVDLFTLVGLIPGPKVHRKWRRLTTHLGLSSYKISPRSSIRSTRYALPIFSHFGLVGLTARPKLTKRGGDLLPPSSTILPNFITLCQPTPEMCFTKYLVDKQTDKQ